MIKKKKLLIDAVLSEPELKMIDNRHITYYPQYAWDSTVGKNHDKISSILHFKSEIFENSYSKIKVTYKGKLLNWAGPFTLYNNDVISEAESLLFPRQHTYDIPISNMENFPYSITLIEERSSNNFLNYYVPTIRIIGSELILVDLTIITPSPNCPENKYPKYWEALFLELSSIDNTNFSSMETPPNFYFLDNEREFDQREMFVFSYLTRNLFTSLGDLRLSIDTLMNDIDKSVLENI